MIVSVDETCAAGSVGSVTEFGEKEQVRLDDDVAHASDTDPGNATPKGVETSNTAVPVLPDLMLNTGLLVVMAKSPTVAVTVTGWLSLGLCVASPP